MEIESNIPFPKSAAGSKIKYPCFRDMEVGDSVFFPGESQVSGSKPYIAAQQYGYRASKKFVGRTIEGGIRIWRVA